MRKAILLTAAVMLVTAGVAGAQGTVVGSGHDLSDSGPNATFTANNTSRICVFCHTPHQADLPVFYDVDPLWNHEETVNAFTVYDSVTMQADELLAPDQAITPIVSGDVSYLCMSCHDGSIGLGSLLNDPNITAGGGEVIPSNSATNISGNALLGSDLSNDHPINFTYDPSLVALDGELNAPASVTAVDGAGVIPLFANATVQCATCHDVHDPFFVPFLVQTNDDSALCLQCHIK